MRKNIDLKTLFSPLDKQAFIDEYLDKKPLIINKHETACGQLFEAVDIDRMMNDALLGGSLFMAPAGGEEPVPDARYASGKSTGNVSVRTGLNRQKVLQGYYQDKNTLVIPDVSSCCSEFYKALEDDLCCTINASMSFTPPEASFVPVSSKANRIIVVLSGNCLADVCEDKAGHENAGEGILRGNALGQGDVIYLPASHSCVITSTAASCVLLCFSLAGISWKDLIIRYIIRSAHTETTLRKGFVDRGKNAVQDNVTRLEYLRHLLLDQMTFTRLNDIMSENIKFGNDKNPIQPIVAADLLTK